MTDEKHNVRERLVERFGGGLMLADGFDNAIIGVSIGHDSERVVYDAKQMVEILVQKENFTEEEALEYLEFNTFGAYIGENTPIYFERLDNDN